ncbi:MAG: hypothetical protein DRO12_03995 [Thermoprotei archaeon]|nr:MAG: hypothetical protein DRO12_03995 [Thermoprotei archaeon]
MQELVFGVRGLDVLLRSALFPGATIVVAGHPGAGKTTLATTICYANARYGNKRCLYLSFQESKVKLFRVAKNLGMELEDAERRGLFRFVNLPIASSAEEIAETINDLVGSFRPDIVVVDSINAVLEPIKDPGKRAWLQNYFYRLAEMFNGLSIIIAELPFSKEDLDLGAIEFVSDVLLMLKHYVKGGKLVRLLEIRKSRGTPIYVAELPFKIVEGQGLKVFVPPMLREIKTPMKLYKFSIELFKELFGEIHAGSSILLVMPPYARTPCVFLPVVDLVLTNKLKVLLVSYKYSVEESKSILKRAFRKIMNEELLDKIFEEFFVFQGFNPYGMSMEEILMAEMELIEEHEPDIVAFHGVDTLYPMMKSDPYRYHNLAVNQIYHLKSIGKIVIRISNYINKEQFRLYSSLADIVVRSFMRIKGDKFEPYLYIWRVGKEPKIIKVSDVLEELSSKRWRDLLRRVK